MGSLRAKATIVMLAIALVVPMLPASAAIDTTASCPAGIPSAGFADLGNLDAGTRRAIDCVAYYEIAQGTSSSTFNPSGDVLRRQMALFLVRQAEVHGIALPDGSPQGFADITGLPADTQTAINQLAQLGITTGTSATTFDPESVVPRWQMALFLTRFVELAGVTLPSGAPQGFEDLGGLSDAVLTAINQVAQLGIADGTSTTTYAPRSSVLRWQMALFLTRTLAVNGIQPEGLVSVTVSPTSAVSLSVGQKRVYTATFVVDNLPYTGAIGVALHEVDSDNTPSYDAYADHAVIEQIDATEVGANVFTGFPGLDGKITFLVAGDGVAEKTIPVVWVDSDGDETPDPAAGNDEPPTEPFALGGRITFGGVPAAEAPTGSYTSVTVSSTNLSGNRFIADDGGTDREFYYDSTDVFLVEGELSDISGFESALSETDVVNVTGYDTSQPTSSVTVTFDIVTDNAVVADLEVTSPSQAITVDANTYTLRGRGEPGWIVSAYVDSVNDGVRTAGEAELANGGVSSSGSWSLTVPLAQGVVNDFVVTMRSSIGADDLGADDADHQAADVPFITEGVGGAAKLGPSAWTDPGGPDGSLNIGDVLELSFTESMQVPVSGDIIELTDTDGTIARLTCGGNVSCSRTASSTITVTMTLFPEIVEAGTNGLLGSPAQIETLEGFTGTDGNDVDVAGSGSDRIVTES